MGNNTGDSSDRNKTHGFIILIFILLIVVLSVLIINSYFKVNNIHTPPFFQIPNQLKTNSSMILQLTQTIVLPTKTLLPKPSATITPTNTITSTASPRIPVTYTYEGVTIKCSCTNCICITKQTFRVVLTIDPQDNVSGTFEKYLVDYPAILLEGNINDIHGFVHDNEGRGDGMEFTGKLSKSLNSLDAMIKFSGSKHTGFRTFLLYKIP